MRLRALNSMTVMGVIVMCSLVVGHTAWGQSPSQEPAQQLPAGHPPIPGALPAGPQEGGPASAIGVLMIKVVQGTKGAPVVSGEKVTVELYSKGKPTKTLEAKLDQKGMAMIEDLLIDAPVQPKVIFRYAGVNYEHVGHRMTPSQPDQMVRITVYEATDKEPAWTIAMRHVMLTRTPHGIQVDEIFTVHNPADRVWRGREPQQKTEKPAVNKHDENDNRVTLQMPLPANAKHVKLGEGFHSCCASIDGNRVRYAMPMLPGTKKYRVTYIIPLTDARAQLDIAGGAPVKHTMVFVPDDGSVVTTQGLTQAQDMKTGTYKLRIYQAGLLQVNQKLKLTVDYTSVAPMSQVGPSQGQSYPTEHSAPPASHAGKTIAGLGVGLMFLLGIVMLFFAKPRKVSTAQRKSVAAGGTGK